MANKLRENVFVACKRFFIARCTDTGSEISRKRDWNVFVCSSRHFERSGMSKQRIVRQSIVPGCFSSLFMKSVWTMWFMELGKMRFACGKDNRVEIRWFKHYSWILWKG